MSTTSYLKRKSKYTPPPLSRSKNSSSSSLNESYFKGTYVPLSSLPTPPLSHSSESSRQQTPDSVQFSSPGETLDPELLGPAIHLTNLIPSSTSLTTASVPFIHTLLSRAHLPLETIALAVCILDSLNSRFALQWRRACPLLPDQHVDSVQPELIVLSALILAVKFIDDHQGRTTEYARDWGTGLWTDEQINHTQLVIMANLAWRLLPLWEEGIIKDAMEDMRRAGSQSRTLHWDDDDDDDVNDDGDEHNHAYFDHHELNHLHLPMSMGKAVLGVGEQLMTPVETPGIENVKGTSALSQETQNAFSSSATAPPPPRKVDIIGTGVEVFVDRNLQIKGIF